MDYKDYVMRQWERRYTEPDENPYEDMSDEEYQEMCDRMDYEQGMREMAEEAHYEAMQEDRL